MSAVSTLEPMQRYQYQLALDLKLRSTYGTAFQDFFSTILEAAHGADFVRVRPFGSLGDKGCDGYRQSNGQVFQCYGKLEDGKLVATKLVKKATSDYALASSHLQTVMKEWHFAHNLVDGVPVELILAIEGLKKANGEHLIGLLSPASLQELVLQLPQTRLETLLGPAATAADTANLRMGEVRDVVAAVIAAVDVGPVEDAAVADVPADKLEFNKLPEHWVQIITAATKNAPYVAKYFEGHPNPEIGDIVATEFGGRYNALKLSSLKPGVIMDILYEQITGIGSVTAAQQVAAQALLAYLFDACEIFEDHSSKVAA